MIEIKIRQVGARSRLIQAEGNSLNKQEPKIKWKKDEMIFPRPATFIDSLSLLSRSGKQKKKSLKTFSDKKS
jgi:hypothetical protein